MAHTMSTTNSRSAGYTVIYRQGGYARFRWLVTDQGQSRDEALRLKASIERQGFKALLVPEANLRHGLPTTWGAQDDVDSVTTLADGWSSQPTTKEVADA